MGPVDVAGEGVQDLNGVFGGGGALNELMQGNKYESFLKTLYSVSGSFKVYGNLT